MASLLQEKKRLESGGNLIQEAREFVGPPEFVGAPAPPEPTDLDRFKGLVAESLTKSLGLPVDVVTSAINVASEALTGEQLVDPARAIGGARSVEEFGRGMKMGLETAGRGVGLLDDPRSAVTRQEEQALVEASPSAFAGELIGEVAPFIAPAAKIGQLATIPARALATGALGATEAGIIARGRGGDIEDIQEAVAIGGGLGAGLEIVLPVAGRVASQIYSRIKGAAPKGALLNPDMTPTPEFVNVLDEAGMSFDDFTQEALSQVKGGAIPSQAERAARFQRQGIPATKGVITQDDVLLGREQTLLGRVDVAGEIVAAPLREMRIKTSQAFERAANDIVEDLGVPDQAGNLIKDALTQRRKLLTREKNELYRAASEADPSLMNVPISTDRIADAVPDEKIRRRLGRIQGSQMPALDDLLVEFGINQNPQQVEKFLGAGNVIEPLSFSNFEDFRQALNQIRRADQGGSTAVAVNPIIDMLDSELDAVFDGINSDPNARASTLDILREARQKVRELKVEFDPKGLTDRLISFKRGDNIPNVEAGQVFKAIAAPSVGIEATRNLVNSLSRAGKVGKRALGDLQAATVFQALDASLSATSNKSGGIQLFSPNAFVRELGKIDAGQNKLDVIFRGNEGILRELRDLEKSAREMVTPSTTMPKGSAPAVNALLGVMSGIRNVPLVRGVVDAVEIGAQATQVRGALDMTPQQRKSIEYISREFPALASVLGVAVITEGDENGE